MKEYIIDKTNSSEVVKAQSSEENKNLDVLSGLPFVLENEEELSDRQKASELKDYFSGLTVQEKADMYKKMLSVPDSEQMEKTVKEYMEK